MSLLFGPSEPADLAIMIVSTNEARWLRPCLSTVFEHAGDATLDVVVIDNMSTDGTRELIESEFPEARVVTSENRGFAHANNRGALTCNARYILFLNPDTEIVEGTFGELVDAMDARPSVGMIGVKQITADGVLSESVRYFPSPVRSFCEAIGSERWSRRPKWSGERELNFALYDNELDCDWTSGSYMLTRTEALLSAGLMDERFFLYAEEPDLCLRMKRAGWEVRHMPTMTIIHHIGKAGIRARNTAQDTYARRQYAIKHFSRPRRAAYLAAVGTRWAIRAVVPGSSEEAAKLRAASRAALAILAGRSAPPFGDPPPTALAAGAANVRADDDTVMA